MKAGVVANLAAVRGHRPVRRPAAPGVALQFVIGEEDGGLGAFGTLAAATPATPASSPSPPAAR